MIRNSSSECASICSPNRIPHGLKMKLVEALTSHTSGRNRSIKKRSGRLMFIETASARWME
jgi:hypothetical protein